MPVIYGRNPVLEAIESKQPIDKIYIQSGRKGEIFSRIYKKAREQNIPIVQADAKKIKQIAEGGKHQGVAAFISPVYYLNLEDLIDKIQKSGELPNLIIVDRIQDPHNFGAIIRSAEFLGAHGIIFSHKNNVPVTDVVVKASSGAVFHIDLCKVGNMVNAVRYVKKCGIWLYASSSSTETDMWKMDFTKPQAVLIGSEGKGVRRILLKESDNIFKINQVGKTESLNASVAAGIILTEIMRQRRVSG